MSPRKRKSPGSGGPREGAPGANYPNRTDLSKPKQPVMAAAGQTYGSRGMQEDAQRAVPLPAPAPPPTPSARGMVTAGPLTPLNAPTQRPNEPVTHGLPVGAGAGPEILGTLNPDAEMVDFLRGVYGAHPTEELRGLIEQMQYQGKF